MGKTSKNPRKTEAKADKNNEKIIQDALGELASLKGQITKMKEEAITAIRYYRTIKIIAEDEGLNKLANEKTLEEIKAGIERDEAERVVNYKEKVDSIKPKLKKIMLECHEALKALTEAGHYTSAEAAYRAALQVVSSEYKEAIYFTGDNAELPAVEQNPEYVIEEAIKMLEKFREVLPIGRIGEESVTNSGGVEVRVKHIHCEGEGFVGVAGDEEDKIIEVGNTGDAAEKLGYGSKTGGVAAADGGHDTTYTTERESEVHAVATDGAGDDEEHWDGGGEGYAPSDAAGDAARAEGFEESPSCAVDGYDDDDEDWEKVPPAVDGAAANETQPEVVMQDGFSELVAALAGDLEATTI